jgi:hypothetical protein
MAIAIIVGIVAVVMINAVQSTGKATANIVMIIIIIV